MQDETKRRYLVVAINRATRWVFIRVYNNKTAANARRFLRDLERTCPLRIRTILTDNGKEFINRFFGSAQACYHGRTGIRQALRRSRHQAPPHPAKIAPNKGHGRTFQRTDRGGAFKAITSDPARS